jgi:hypothetical protein
MVKRIKFLVEKRLTSMMVLFDFLSRRIAPLRQHARVAWLYTGEDDASRLERDRGTDLDLKVPPSPRHLACQFSWTRRRGRSC